MYRVIALKNTMYVRFNARSGKAFADFEPRGENIIMHGVSMRNAATFTYPSE